MQLAVDVPCGSFVIAPYRSNIEEKMSAIEKEVVDRTVGNGIQHFLEGITASP